MFTHLHVHTAYSFLDGYCHIPKLVSRAKELGMTSLAITDHNHMGGIYEFQKECNKQGIKPILGYEGYQTWNSNELAKNIDERWTNAAIDAFREGVVTEEEAQAVITKKKGFKGIKEVKERIKPFMYDTRQYHLILLAMNQTGLNNLIKLQSEAAKTCTYNGRFLFDMGMLRKYNEGVICTTACVANMAAKTLNSGDKQLAETILLEYKDIFKDRFYLEVQPNDFDDQINVNNFYIEMHKKHDIPLVATSDVHYVLKTDNKDHDVLVCIGTGTDIFDSKRMRYDHNYWLKSEEEMQEDFKKILNKSEKVKEVALEKYALYLEAMKNTQVIANMVEDVTLGSKTPLMPKLPGSKNIKKELRELAYKGLYKLAKRYKYIADDIINYEKRLAYELNIINYKDFADYMLIVREYLNWADNNNIMTGMGRGCSKAGTRITMSDGTVKNIEDVKVGDKVLSHTGNIRKIKNTFVYDIEEPLTRIKCSSNDPMDYTNDHKFLIIKQKECVYYTGNLKQRRFCNQTCKRKCKYIANSNLCEPEWIPVSKVRKNDICLYPKARLQDDKQLTINIFDYVKNNCFMDNNIVRPRQAKAKDFEKTYNNQVELNNNFYRFIGYMLGNGYTNLDKYGTARYGCAFPIKHSLYAEDYCNLAKEIFNDDLKSIPNKNKTCISYLTSSKVITHFIHNLIGDYAINKKIPNFMINNDQEKLINLLAGLFRTDGHIPNKINSDSKINYSSISYNLVSQIKLVLSYLGISSYITKREHKEKGWQNEYKLEISKFYIPKFAELMKDFLDINFEDSYNINTSLIKEDDNYFYFNVRSVEALPVEKTKVYDFEVDIDHSYIGNNTIVHNSAAGSLVLWCLGITKNVDPIKHDLLFGRFLTIDRTGLPDIDSDVSYFGRDKVIQHIKDLYGESNVAHIGTYTQQGVKSGLKDVGRALKVPFDKMNLLSKEIDKFEGSVPPQPKFKDYDSLKDGNETEKSLYAKWKKLEADNKEIFRLARAFEGLKRNFGVHASGVLAMPCRVDDYFPTRTDDNGIMITLFTGAECEELGTAKLDILGLKTLSIIEKTLDHLNKDVDWLYDNFDIEDKKLYQMLACAKSDCIFQLESDMFKDYLQEMKPTCFDDIAATTSLLRPGPLSAGMHHQYAKRKHGLEKTEFPLHGIENIVGDTYFVIAYQEQLMQIAKQVSGFDDNQADSLVRKPVAKKKISMFPMMIRCHIYGKKNCEGPEGWEDNNELPWYDPKSKYGPEIKGAIANGYTAKEMNDYFDYIMGFASYAFNRSHAVAYSFISMLTTWLKLYHPIEFYSAFLSMQATEDLLRYIPMIRKEGIDVKVPNVNISNTDFTPDGSNILFGLGSIKGVGESSIPAIIENRPYSSLEDALNKIGKKSFNKRVGEALIMSGAFDTYKNNRNELLNEFHEIRKDKKEDILDVNDYNEEVIMDYEMKSLSCPVTCTPEWFDYEDNSEVNHVPIMITKIDERKDSKGNLMAFCEGDVGGGVIIDLVIFSSIYLSNIGIIRAGHVALFTGEKQSNSKLKVKKVSLS